jgi:23S rRNA (uridine2552-2'-O)-methyltransferase
LFLSRDGRSGCATAARESFVTKPKNPSRRRDAFTKAAKAQGYPARSVFKLEEIDRRTRLLRSGQRVIDLGAAPGSWSMYVAKRIGSKGRLLSIDLSPILVAIGPNATVKQGDALALTNDDLALFAPYDVVLSDMAPATTGSREADQWRSYELFVRAVAVAEALCAEGGSFVGKIFMSEDFPKAKAALKQHFEEVRAIRPEGTRPNSYELFLIGLKRKPRPPAPPATAL